jgi:restriction system protein
MAIPDYQSIMLPLLKYAGDEEEHSLREAIEALAENFNLTDEEKRQLLPSGQQATFDNRVGWARTYLKKARLLKYTRRGHFRITERGKSVLENNPSRIDRNYLKKFSEFVDFITPDPEEETKASRLSVEEEKQTPEEHIEHAYQRVRKSLVKEILQTIQDQSPAFFERLVIDLLTTSSFSQTTRDYVSRIDSKIVLIDGETLAQLMIDFNIGVTAIASYEIKRIDSDYFTEE